MKAYFGSQARKASIKNSKSGQATAENFNYWPHFERLAFLKDVFEQNQTVDNLMEDETDVLEENHNVERVEETMTSDINPTNRSTRNQSGATRKRVNIDNNLGGSNSNLVTEDESVVIGRTQVNPPENTKRKRTNRDEVVANTLSVVSNTLTNINNNRNPPKNNRAIAYGCYVGQVIESLSDHLQIEAINKINKILYEAEKDNIYIT